MPPPHTGTPIRFSRRKDALRQASINAEPAILIPDIGTWLEAEATFDRNTLVLEATKSDEAVLLESPPFMLPANTTVYFSLFVEANGLCGARLSLRSTFRSVVEQAVKGSGEIALTFRYLSKRSGRFTLSLSGYQPDIPTRARLRVVRLTVRSVAKPESVVRRPEKKQSFLPRWTKWQRSIHSLCSRSRWINAAIATWEMHLGREEMLSLPQYMAICPTGQCNASCGFCSVTTNRTGIIKKQLPFDALDHFLSPVVGTLRLFGLEGNGEPTLYDQFDELLFKATSRDAPIYLITNGERLSADQIALLLASPTDAINFSLNAATAETHRRVMKLKGWDAVMQNISRFVRWRGDARRPTLSVSLVVTRDNAHEVQQFLHLAEWHLKVDRILIRPLSEIANDSGVIEDMRDLVPYESQIGDMLDAVEEYLEFVPRRAEVIVDPTAFNAFRHEPRDAIVSPPGFEDQLLVPRRTDWRINTDHVLAIWHLNRLSVSSSAQGIHILAKSGFIPVIAGRRMTFRCRVQVPLGTVRIAVVDETGKVLGAEDSNGETHAPRLMAISFLTPSVGGVAVELCSDGCSVDATIDFGRMYAWPAVEARKIKLPHGSRWQVDTPGTIARWQKNELLIEAKAPAGIYLYRSYRISTSPDELISLTVKVEVIQGALGIGILSEDGNQWLAAGRYQLGFNADEISFNSSNYEGFQVVLYALADEPLRAHIDWGDNIGPPPVHKSRVIQPRQLLLPHSANWTVDLPGAEVSWNGSVVHVGWNVVDSVSSQLVNVDGLYLLRSCRFPCPHLYNERPIASVHVSVKSGLLGIGFLGGKTETLTAVFYFPEGEHDRILDVDTEGQQNLMVVLFSSAYMPLEASVDWGKCLNLVPHEAKQEWRGGLFDPRDNESGSDLPAALKQLLLPAQKHWVADAVGPRVKWIDTRVKLVWPGPKVPLLLHSPLFPSLCKDNETPIVSVRITVDKGRLGIGFTTGPTERHTTAVSLPVGVHHQVLKVDTDEPHHLMVVLFSDGDGPLDATVEWGDNFAPESMDAPEGIKSSTGKYSMRTGIAARLARIYRHAGIAGVMRKATGVVVRRLADHSLTDFFALAVRRLSEVTFMRVLKKRFPSNAIYCQKPWTDLNNFTVDGRMDVCCIATGPSQERYALGNIYKQDFQEIWNGEPMKEFRRTVNARDKLPPCARCPMANNYRPPF